MCSPQVTEKSVVVGACVSLTQLIDFLCQNKDKSSSFEELANHLQTIGNVAVRNVSGLIPRSGC